MPTWSDDTLRAVQRSVQRATEIECPDPGPCVNGPTPHLWDHPSCGPDRDGGW